MTHTTRTIILLFFGLFGLGLLLLYVSFNKDSTALPKQTPVETSKTPNTSAIDWKVFEGQVKNALITVPETTTKISLVNGQASYGTTLDGGDVTLTKLIGGERVSSGATHVFADIAVQSGGTGVFHYVGLFGVTSGKVTHLSSSFIGDRVSLVSASTTPKDSKSYMLTVKYLDRKEGEPMVEDPSVQREIQIEVRNSLFVESVIEPI